MGLLEWFWKPKASQYVQMLPDSIWLNKLAKFQGIARAADCSTQADCVILLGHFEDTVSLLLPIAEHLAAVKGTLAHLASDLATDAGLRNRLMTAETSVVFVAERHPLPTEDDLIAARLNEFQRPIRLGFHVSLEDPLMRAFSGDWVEGALRRLGMQEHERIESAMVQRRLLQAQKKLAARYHSNTTATSGEEWMRLNNPRWSEKKP